jgi:hypothetical protein
MRLDGGKCHQARMNSISAKGSFTAGVRKSHQLHGFPSRKAETSRTVADSQQQ